ncbi:LysR substrate-binding domain-containing protein [Gemmiger formicilis]|uniref:LysR substrate-binding domain-containing protein n=1 Tax=Gemmiger formicilis TaxID=745368 RepID=UPI0031F65C3B
MVVPPGAWSSSTFVVYYSKVAKGTGISILMEQAVRRQHTPGLAVVPLQSDWRSYLSFVRLRQAEHSRAAGLFWRYLHRCYPKSE